MLDRLGFRQDAAAAADHRVGAEHESAGMALCHELRFLRRETLRMLRRQLVLARRLIDIGGIDGIGHDADLRQQLAATR